MPGDGVLLTDAPANATLAAARSLGRRGIRVGVCQFGDEFNLASHSRYVSERITVPSPMRQPEGFITAVADAVRRGPYGIVLPTTERTMQLLSRGRARLPRGTALPIPDAEAVEAARDKERTIALARSLDVPVPDTWCPDGADEARALAPRLPYPVLVKPRQTNFEGPDGRLGKASLAKARCESELLPAYARVHRVVPRPLIQAIVTGVGAGVFSLWDHGSPLGWFAHRRVREEDPRGSRASAAVSVRPDPDLVKASTRLLESLRWHGVAMVEFKWEGPGGRFWLMEVNGRFWGSLALALVAGVDFPYYLVQLARGEQPVVPAGYPEGVLARDAVAEVKHFLRVMRGPRRELPATVPSRLLTLRRAVTILHPWRASYNWTADDPRPGRRQWVRVLTRRTGGG